MGGEIISLVSSNEIFRDITENASNSQPRDETRGDRGDPARSPPRKTLPVVLELSDLSDSSDFPDASSIQPRRGPLRKDPRQIFHRTASSTARPRAGGKLGVAPPPPPLRRAFDDPIELSSTPDFGPKVKWVGVPESRQGAAAAACRHDSFTFLPRLCGGRYRPRDWDAKRPRLGNPARAPRPSAMRDPEDEVEVSVQSLVDTPSPFSELSPPRRTTDWDPISSSAPEILPPPRREEDVINIDSDSEDLGRAASISSDESFPDVSNLGPSTTTHHRTSLSRPGGSTTERDRKKREREAAKEQRLKDKARAAALAEVNKVKTDKKISARIENARWDSGPVGHVVRWRRRVRARYDEDRGHYEPIPERVEDETFALALLDADEFVGLCLDPWMRRNRNLRNRQFAAAVRNVGGTTTTTTTTTSSTAGSRRPRAEYVDEETIESGLLALQVLHGALIHHASAPVETAQWIVTFTQHISTVPYRRRRDEANASAAAFCMDAGQVRVGEGAADTYVRMLQEITRVTAPVAYGIAAECPSIGDLVARLETGARWRCRIVGRR
ncbi:unnamed protein product [Parascedosporium putredinis]|uniref:ERCC4 domain-containing protein n=1 Tax=Parascedosporium putredinis TaxID=1442378 RepID=A0A9P1MG83_9PEZI|nr:unnamed protein product [Parascedosporium putredinis]CAI8004968.1 unnamed protein product [Parascedosporium putredinis]